ncbi:MAG: hypothetical protein ACF8SC_09290 [Phycisphaerales bacterium JB037]
MTRAHHARRAFSMIEVSIATVLTAGLLMAALTAAGRVGMGNRVIDERARGHALAHELLAEIQVMLYETPDYAPGSFGKDAAKASSPNRLVYGDVDDYHGWSASPPQSRDGTPMTELAGWTRSVVVEWIDGSGRAVAYDTGMKRITVSVLRDGRTVGSAVAIRTRGWDALGPNRDDYREPEGDDFALEDGS